MATRLTNALARGPALTQFGIGLTSAEINAPGDGRHRQRERRQADPVRKAAAGARIAVERLGSSMGSDFAAGAENAQTVEPDDRVAR